MRGADGVPFLIPGQAQEGVFLTMTQQLRTGHADVVGVLDGTY